MGYSKLVSHVKISPNRTVPRNHIIDTITIHCMAGDLTVQQCGNIFAKSSKQSSSNYGVDSKGNIAVYVDENDRSWCSSSSSNDNRAVTIEVANDGGAETGWHVSNLAMKSLINLLADVCKRNNIKELKWKGNKSLIGNIAQQNMTVHRWFKNKACPGDYLYGKHGYIANEVNKLLSTPSTNTDYSLVFDAIYYANKYADLKTAFGNDSAKLLSHFINNGMKEGRQAISTFNVNTYKNNYADLRSAFCDDLVKYYQHYITNGHSEGRIAI